MLDSIISEVIGGIIVTVIAGLAGYLIKSGKLSRHLLPNGSRGADSVDYARLSGAWHQYYISYFPNVSTAPIWLHSLQEIEVYKKNLVRGQIKMDKHPSIDFSFLLRGEIKHGRMILVYYYCEQDETEFASIIYPDIAKRELVGVWTGFDGQNNLISAPTVMSQRELSEAELNELLSRSLINIVGVDKAFKLHSETKPRNA